MVNQSTLPARPAQSIDLSAARRRFALSVSLLVVLMVSVSAAVIAVATRLG